MNRLFRFLDLGLGLALATALTLALLGGWPGAAGASEVLAGSGRTATEVRPLGDFQAIAISGAIATRISQGKRTAVQIRADDNLLTLLETVIETRAGTPTLLVRWRKGVVIRDNVTPLVEITVVQLQSLASSGASDVVIDTLATPRLQLALSGSGDIRAKDWRGDALDVAVAGSGRVVAAGRAQRLGIKVSGSGDVDSSALQADEVSVSIAGSGDVNVHADRTLAVSIAGSGDVVYGGNATLQSKVAGSGTVRKR